MSNVEDISTYSPSFIQTYNNLVKTAATTYDFPENVPKKNKKWSIGNLFRRKKKVDSSSSEDEINKKTFFNKRKCKLEKRKKGPKPVGAFDHIVMSYPSRTSYIKPHAYIQREGILSDPSEDCYSGHYSARLSTVNNIFNNKSLSNYNNNLNTSSGSVDSVNRKSRKDRTKARAIARRDSFQRGSSSDEDSQQSYTSSKFKSDESLMRHRDGSLSRRSRTARTERYNRRISKDDESILNQEAFERKIKPNWQFSQDEMCKVRSLSPRPTSIYKSSDFCINDSSISHPNISGLFTIPPSQSINSRYRFSSSNHLSQYETTSTQPHTSYSYFNENNVHRRMSPEVPVMHIKIPLGNYNYSVSPPRLKQQTPPPVPPPRDPNRIMQYENKRPSSQYFDKSLQHRINPPINAHYSNSNTFSNWHLGCRTTSEDYIPTERQPLSPRPSSVTNENRHRPLSNRNRSDPTDKFQYLTEKKPRSRKPIFIQSTELINSNSSYGNCVPGGKNVTYKKDDNNYLKNTIPLSPQIFTAESNVQTKIFLPSVLKSNDVVDGPNNQFQPISSSSSPEEQHRNTLQTCKQKSANLEEALDELEAIYKSLHLGDEDLLERAEQRETAIASKLVDSKLDQYSRGAISDSSFSYEPYDFTDTPKSKKVLKKSQTLDRKSDDMAFRKLNKYSPFTTKNHQSNLANVSYLLTSPINCLHDESQDVGQFCVNNEPDVTLDDVVYRNIKHNHNTLKVIEPQPPFGIPVGHVIPAPNSDYLHADPDNPPMYDYKFNKIPDVVKDDLAFRNLRKDPNKEPVLKLISGNTLDSKLKKKRAVRSLSANISNLLLEENYKHDTEDNDNEFRNTKLSDIADAMEIAHKILKEKENRINSNKRAFLSDSETKYRKLGLTSASSTETITDCRLNFLNEMRNNELEKDQTHPFNSEKLIGSPNHTYINNILKKNSLEYETPVLEDFITTFTIESTEEHDSKLNERKDKHINSIADIDSVSEHTKLCEKLLECVMESTDLITSLKPESINARDEIDDVIPKPANNMPLALHENVHSPNLGQSCEKNNLSDDDNNGTLINEINTVGATCKSPFEEHKAELIASFKELNILEEVDNKSNVNDEIKEYCGGEECVLEVFALPGIQECAYKSEANIVISKKELTYTTNCDIYIKNDHSDSQPSSGFHSNSSCTDSICNENIQNELTEVTYPIDQIPSILIESLKSPKLVTTAMKREHQKFENIANVSKSNNLPKQDSSLLKNHSSGSSKNSRDLRHTLDKTRSWYGDPFVLVFACSYGVACSYQLASLDVVVILGLLFLIISIVAALILD